ncbi:MAG: aldehyde dehydrogenase (NADP(+)) [Nocardioidaceae bacterium]
MTQEGTSRERVQDISWVNPRDRSEVGTGVPLSTAADVTHAAGQAGQAASVLAERSLAERVDLLEAVAGALERSRPALVLLADEETALGEARLNAELTRTVHQLRFLADVIGDGSFLDATIDLAEEATALGAVPDLRRAGRAIGPVAVFAASNFPFAFSVAGGDTASALAAGCPVVVKAHPGHPRLSAETGRVVQRALASVGSPEGTLAVVHGWEAGSALVRAPEICAVGFTGSQQGGRALWNLANARPEPIPFFGELGSLNPVVVTPAALRRRADEIAAGFVASFTLGGGQFCTKPGLMFVPAGGGLDAPLRRAVADISGGFMLTPQIRDALAAGVARFEQLDGVESLAEGDESTGGLFAPARLFRIRASDLANSRRALLDECFGPVSVIVEYADDDELFAALALVPGSLTFTVHADSSGDPLAPSLMTHASTRAGRVIVNGWPTGVAVRHAMHHGGPHPTSTTPAATSVGSGALQRFLVPVCFQNVPDELLPPPLRNANPWGIRRRVNGQLTVEPIQQGREAS